MNKEYKVNHQIRSNVVSLVLSDGTMRGTTPIDEALELAEQENLDLVEIAPGKDDLPICKIIDYGKMMYQQSKKEKGNKQIQHTKEIKYGPNIAIHDLKTKHNQIKKFLSKHYLVKYTLELQGSREKLLVSEAMEKMLCNLSEFIDIATWKEPSISDGNKKIEIFTVLHPK